MEYTINDRTEETECDYCGYPLYIGDNAILADGDRICGIYCSETCAELDQSTSVLLTDGGLHGTMIA